MCAEWPVVRLGDHVDLLTGHPFKRARFTDAPGDVRLVKGANVGQGDLKWDRIDRWPAVDTARYERYLLETGDVILAMDRPWITAGLKQAVVTERDLPALLLQRVARLRGIGGLRTDFLRYVIGSSAFSNYIEPIVTGVNVPHISPDQISDYRFALPPVLLQEQIAAVLAAYDELIEINLRRIELLEEMEQAVYREWFVNFRFPGHEGTPLAQSPVGEVPSTWAVVRLGDDVELAYGKALKADARTGGAIPVYGSSGVVGWHDEYLVPGPGIVVGRKGNVGSVYWTDGDFYPIDTTFYVRSNLPLSYLYHNLQSQHFLNSDAAVPGLNRNQAYANPLIVPPDSILGLFDEIVRPMVELRRNLDRQNENLRETRDLLVPRLLSGEIDVSDLDIDTKRLAS